MKQKLQSVTDYKLMSLEECLKALNWTYNTTEDRFIDIVCDCGGELEYSGFLDTELVACKNCKKFVKNIFSPMPASNSTCVILDPSDYEIEENRFWIAANCKCQLPHN